MKVLVSEKLSPHKMKTPEGYLICTDAVLARTGKQTYKKSEIFADADDTEIEIDRKPEEVFSEKTLASFENKPITVEHPNEDVNSTNYKTYAVGFVRDVHKGTIDGQDVILGNLVITDAQTIEEIENGEHTDLSCGYDCDIVDEENPQQRNIRGNHVALCEQGRAGNARIIDSMKDANNIHTLKAALHNLSKMYFNDPGIEYVIVILTNLGYNVSIDSIKGWQANRNISGEQIKQYVLNITLDGKVHHALVQLYADEGVWRVKEINAYMLDSITDTSPQMEKVAKAEYNELKKQLELAKTDVEYANITTKMDELRRKFNYTGDYGHKYEVQFINSVDKAAKAMTTAKSAKQAETFIRYRLGCEVKKIINIRQLDSMKDELIQSGSKEALKKNIATEIRAGKDPKQAAAIAYNIKRENDSEMNDTDYSRQTKQGYEVVEIYRDGGRLHAIVKRVNDYVVALGYDTSDGTWAQGRYVSTYKSALETLKEEKPYARKIQDAESTYTEVTKALEKNEPATNDASDKKVIWVKEKGNWLPWGITSRDFDRETLRKMYHDYEDVMLLPDDGSKPKDSCETKDSANNSTSIAKIAMQAMKILKGKQKIK